MRNKENTKEAEGILIRISKEMERQGKKQAELVKYLDLPLGTYTVNVNEYLSQVLANI